MRGTIALQLCAAHLAGIVLVAIIGSLTGDSPAIGDALLLVWVGGFTSLFLFLPVLILCVIFARVIYMNVLAFVVAGPIIVSALNIWLMGPRFGGSVAIGVVASSIVFLALVRKDNPALDAAEV